MSTPRQVVKGTANEVFTMAQVMGTDAILHQESQGQDSLVHSEQLPVEGSPGDRCSEEHEEAWLGTGIQFGPSTDGELFRNAALPDGWKLKATDHSMHSELLDDKGRVRATIFYKAALYDRSARVDLQRRFYVRKIFGKREFDEDRELTLEVTDAGARVFESTPLHVPGFPGHDDTEKFEEWRKAGDKANDDARDECVEWLVENGYPEWEHVARYW